MHTCILVEECSFDNNEAKCSLISLPRLLLFSFDHHNVQDANVHLSLSLSLIGQSISDRAVMLWCFNHHGYYLVLPESPPNVFVSTDF